MILEESVLKAVSDAKENGEPEGDLACIYPWTA